MAKNNKDFLNKLLLSSALGLTGYLGGSWLYRKAVQTASNSFLHRLMTDDYKENLWLAASMARKIGLQNILEHKLRTQGGKIIQRPLGSPKSFPKLDSIMFNFAQLHPLPTDEGLDVDTRVTIGPRAKKPLEIEMPILISGMAYGLALSAKAKIALAKGCTRAGIAANTGEGPFLPAERKAAEKLILQYNRGTWSKSEKILKQADMIEIHFGQGAGGGTGHAIPNKNISWTLRRAMGLKWGQKAIIHANFPEIDQPDKLADLVNYLREITEGAPIGVKLAASKYLEDDLDIALGAGIDVVAFDCSEAGSKGTAPILQDDHGLPSLFALARATEYFRKNKLKDKVSLIVGGGFYNPGQMLKALALGADAVYIGAIALFAMSHTQVLKAVPWEPPPSVVFYKGHFQKKFKVNEGAKSLAKYLTSATKRLKKV